jgi:hypothetical protein
LSHEDLLTQAEAARAELLAVAVDLARRLRCVSLEEAESAALAVHATRRGLGESSLYEAQVTEEVLALVEDALRGGDPT